MRERPAIGDATIRALLETHYGLSVAALSFLPIGNDAASFVYRVDADAQYFLKVRAASGFSEASLMIPHVLGGRGVPHVVAPLATREGALWVRAGEFHLSLSPFLVARTAAEARLSAEQWRALGETVRRIHESEVSAEIARILPRETFVPSRREVLSKLASTLAKRDLADSFQCQLRAFWQERRAQIDELLQRADRLGDALRRESLPRVLCHADLHTWNVLVDETRQMWIVDWDETVLAPKERDLMFVIGGIGRDLVAAEETSSFLLGYGETAVDARALDYYRCAWAVQDMGAYAEQVLFAPAASELARGDALRAFIDLFAPGNIVAIAGASR